MTRRTKAKPNESKTTNPKLTAYERTRARQTGASVEQLRAERNRVLAWAREFGNRPLGQITREEIEAWRRERMTTSRPATINRDLSRLRRMFSLAVEWGLLEESPMQGIKFLRENNARTRY